MAPLILNVGNRWKLVVNVTPCSLYPQEPLHPLNMRLGGVPEPGRTVLKKRKPLACVGIRAPDCPVGG